MKFEQKYITPLLVGFIFLAFNYLYLAPHKADVNSLLILGYSSTGEPNMELTTIAQMPFLTYRNEQLNLKEMTISDDIFSQPIDQPTIQAEAIEASEVANLDDYAPIEIKPTVDYAMWAMANIKLEALTGKGAIINDKYYSVGKALELRHTFDDGVEFQGTLKSISGKTAQIILNDASVVNLSMSKAE